MRRRRKGGNRRWAQQRGSFQLHQVVRQAFCCNVKPHLKLHQRGARHCECVGQVTWPSAIAPFIVTLLEQWPAYPRLALPAALKEVFSYQVSPISCRSGPKKLRPLCARQAQRVLVKHSQGCQMRITEIRSTR